MVAARTARGLAGFRYEDIINAIDWNRVLIQAMAQHARETDGTAEICGACVRSVLLRTQE